VKAVRGHKYLAYPCPPGSTFVAGMSVLHYRLMSCMILKDTHSIVISHMNSHINVA
jgi:hypothetical protein